MFVAGNPFKSQRILPEFLPASLYFGVLPTIFRAAGSYYIPCVAASSPTHMMVRLSTIGKLTFLWGDELIISWGCSCSGSGLVRISEPDSVWCAEPWLVSQLPGGVPFHSHLESQRSPPLVWWLVVCRLMVKGANKGGFTIKIGVYTDWWRVDKGGDYGWLVGFGHLRGDDVKQALQYNDVYDAFVWIDATMVWGIGFTIYKSKSSRVTRDLDVDFHFRQWACSNGSRTPVSNQLAKLALCWKIFPFLPPISPNS